MISQCVDTVTVICIVRLCFTKTAPIAGVQSETETRSKDPYLSWGILSRETGSEPRTSSSSWYNFSWTSSEVDRKWSAQIHTVKSQHVTLRLQKKRAFLSLRNWVRELISNCCDSRFLQLAVMTHPANVKTMQSSIIWNKQHISFHFQTFAGTVKMPQVLNQSGRLHQYSPVAPWGWTEAGSRQTPSASSGLFFPLPLSAAQTPSLTELSTQEEIIKRHSQQTSYILGQSHWDYRLKSQHCKYPSCFQSRI